VSLSRYVKLLISFFMTSLSLCKVVIGYSLQLVGNKVLALLLRIITCHKDIVIISKNYAKTLKSMLFDTHLYAHLDRMTALLPYCYVKQK
jgi:hypothetical protein